MSLEFEWDPEKRRTNIRAHGIDFLDVRKIFEGPMLAEIDDREDYGEERSVAFGMAGLTVLCVVYTIRGQTIRLISARKADFYDEQSYFREIYGRGT